MGGDRGRREREEGRDGGRGWEEGREHWIGAMKAGKGIGEGCVTRGGGIHRTE